MKHLQPKPTCSTCPFFRRVAGAALNDPGECLHDRATPFPMPNPRGGLQVIGLRSQTTHDATCSSHPRMREWLEQNYGPPLDPECGDPSYGRDDDTPTMPDHHAAQDAPDEREPNEKIIVLRRQPPVGRGWPMSDRDPIVASLGDDCIVVVVRKADVAHLSRVDSIFMGLDPVTGGNRYLSLMEILTGTIGGIFAVHADELVTLDELGRWLAPAAPEREEEKNPAMASAELKVVIEHYLVESMTIHSGGYLGGMEIEVRPLYGPSDYPSRILLLMNDRGGFAQGGCDLFLNDQPTDQATLLAWVVKAASPKLDATVDYGRYGHVNQAHFFE